MVDEDESLWHNKTIVMRFWRFFENEHTINIVKSTFPVTDQIILKYN